MANQLFPKGREAFLRGDIAWLTSTIRAGLVRGFTAAQITTSQDYFDDLTAIGATLVQWQTLGTKDASLGVADAADVTFTTISGAAIPGLVLVEEESAADSGRRLIGWIDTATGLVAGVGITPNGGNITVTWDDGVNKIFKL